MAQVLTETSDMGGRGKGEAEGHFGELLQFWSEVKGELKVTIASLPCPVVRSHAEVKLSRSNRWSITPPDRTKALKAAVAAASHLGLKCGGAVTLSSNNRVAAGMGSSGADCKAVILACFAAAGEAAPREDVLVDLLRQAGESALDTTLLASNCLLASRTFEVVERFTARLPELICVGFDSSPDQMIITSETWREPPHGAFARTDARLFLDAFRTAINRGDATLLGRVSTACARRGQTEIFNPLLEEVVRICECTGGLGVARSYTGTMLGLLFDPRDRSLPTKMRSACQSILTLNDEEPVVFSTHGHGLLLMPYKHSRPAPIWNLQCPRFS